MSLPIRIELPEHFLEKEVRCGYEVSEKLKKIWAVELDLLKQLLDVCKRHNINVQVFAGTLLGAVRHKGMIPWDDDIDVCMTRSDYKRLCQIASKEFKYPYFFQNALTDRERYSAYARLRNSETTAIITGCETAKYNNGIYIDIFPLDGYFKSKILETFHFFLIRVFGKFCFSYYGWKDRKILPVILSPFLHFLPYSFWCKMHDMIVAMATPFVERIGIRASLGFGRRYFLLKSELKDIIELPFENIKVPVPREYERVLTRTYGDFMTFPPMEQRGKWHEGKIHFEPDIPYKVYLKEIGR